MRKRSIITLILMAVLLAASLPSGAIAGDWNLSSRRVYPNPFTEGTTFQLTMPKSAHIRVSVYDLLGRHVRTLIDGVWGQGEYPVPWDGKDLNGVAVPAGIYICVLFSEDVAVKSVKVMKIAA